LTRIYTRTGDDGTTGLGTGERIPKDSPRIEAIGTVDELNSLLGTVLAHGLDVDLRTSLETVQNDLFDLGGELSIPGSKALVSAQVSALESALDRLNATLPPLQEFVLPGGTPAAAACHVARSVCRRAERRLWALGRTDTVNPVSQCYLNRLSDLLFVLARVLARAEGSSEPTWRRGSAPSG
jgi:cob(I)alamin adenosyltransferase